MAKDFFAPCKHGLFFGITLAALAAAAAGCGKPEQGPVTAASGRFEVDDGSPAAPAPESPGAPNPEDSGTPASDPPMAIGDVPSPPTTPPIGGAASGAPGYTVPEGKDALLAFLERMQQERPKGQSQQEMLEDYRAIHAARIQAADKLLGDSPDKKYRVAATQAKLDALRALARLGDNQSEKDLNAYSREIAQDADAEIANLGRLMLFGMSLDELGNGEVTDIQPLLAELKQLIADQPDAPGVFMLTRQAAMMMQQLGHKDAAAEAYLTIGNAYKDSEDEQIAAEVKSMLEQAAVQSLEAELELDSKLRALLTNQPDSAQPVMEAMKTLLGGEAPGEYALAVTSQIAQLLEISGNYGEATEAFALLEKTYENHPNASLATQATARAANGRRRAGLIGQPFTVTGVRTDGSPFDWGKYQGKVVLVDFWATWCGPCLQEIPTIDAAYKKFKDQGFEVVGVNLDEDRQTVERFLDVQPLPWTTVVSADPNAQGFENPLAVQCGIDAIPFLVLVDREGNVDALHVRGERLEEKLTEMLKPAG